MSNERYRCPVCYFPDMEDPPQNYSICPSCGCEFDLDDYEVSHDTLRQAWITKGRPWFSSDRPKPADWPKQETL